MALGTTGITTTIVGQTIGLASNDVGTLCVKAKSGGVNGYAYDNSEMLIDNAKPYHNIYSNYSPAYWYIENYDINTTPTTKKFYNKMKSGPIGPAYNLGKFGGYNHGAITPEVYPQNQNYEVKIGYVGELGTEKSINLMVDKGELDYDNIFTSSGLNSWLTASNAHFGCGSVKKSGSEIGINRIAGNLPLSDADGTNILPISINTSSFTSAGSYPLSIKLRLSNSDEMQDAYSFICSNIYTTNINAVVKERPSISASRSIVFYDDYDAVAISLNNLTTTLHPASGSNWSTYTEPYTGARYNVSGTFDVLISSAYITFYLSKVQVANSDMFNQALYDGNLIKIKNGAIYNTGTITLSIPTTALTTTINDEKLYLVAYIEDYTE